VAMDYVMLQQFRFLFLAWISNQFKYLDTREQKFFLGGK